MKGLSHQELGVAFSLPLSNRCVWGDIKETPIHSKEGKSKRLKGRLHLALLGE